MFIGKSQMFGVDLGTSNTRIYRKGIGIVLQEPSVVAVRSGTREVVAYGSEAEAMIGRTPGSLEVVYPLIDGTIADFELASAMLQHFIGKVQGKRSLLRGKAEYYISVPCGITSVQKRAVEDTVLRNGAKRAVVIEDPIAAAWGAGLPVDEPGGNMILDIGGGKSQIAVVSLGGIVVSRSVNRGGMSIDKDIADYVKKTYNLEIGQRTAEEIKKRLAFAVPADEEARMEVRGRDTVLGLPRSITLGSGEISDQLDAFFAVLTDSIRATLERCPPELAGDLLEKGVTLCGGGALLHGIGDRLREETGVPFHLPEHPDECTVLGIGKLLSGSRSRNPVRLNAINA
ncbi:rod shape-determining protein [Paenibacillus thermoaerophilus]|uniref:Cell shape-determining protein MreB n=1 Tax=Paenibacillus thermoaerophilus TaxID=1215385 RepID=A0ABW2V0G8_9BACL|nr:rod shape-determining protein [Paenibacillus thermoaerophilus]TMV10426.1 rod shape-determining protein [Paenibacillus thermoaerophilus]